MTNQAFAKLNQALERKKSWHRQVVRHHQAATIKFSTVASESFVI
jgi:hypothetical protein